MSVLSVLAALAVFEIGLVLLIRRLRQRFQWLVTERDELPHFDAEALEKFFDYSFDPHLGWVRKANSSGIEKGKAGNIEFHINAAGARASSFDTNAANDAPPAEMAVFGDSYAFCRQVADDQSWEAQLAKHKGIGVLNFGVGNYGVDQAVLRYESTVLPDTVRFAVMCFVPETICRVQSYWKHYLEFGNTFAFKPRFVLGPQGTLELLDNPIRSAADFATLAEKLPVIQKNDGFYEEKFRSFQFRFPYTLSLLRHPLQHGMLIAAVALRGLFRTLHISWPLIDDMPFTLVMKNNIRDAHRQYQDRASTALLDAILMRFAEQARLRNQTPLVVVIPQFFDTRLNTKTAPPYRQFFNQLATKLPVIDLTEHFIATHSANTYINDQFGGHLSVEGNRLVSERVSIWLEQQKKNHGTS